MTEAPQTILLLLDRELRLLTLEGSTLMVAVPKLDQRGFVPIHYKPSGSRVIGPNRTFEIWTMDGAPFDECIGAK